MSCRYGSCTSLKFITRGYYHFIEFLIRTVISENNFDGSNYEILFVRPLLLRFNGSGKYRPTVINSLRSFDSNIKFLFQFKYLWKETELRLDFICGIKNYILQSL